MSLQRLSIALLLLAFPIACFAQNSPVGHWKTIDDETGKPKSVVEIYKTTSGTLAGKVIEILQSDDGPNPLCDKCTGSNKDKPIKGMVILWGLKADGEGHWSGGKILDPAKGKTYKSKITLTNGGSKLQMRGYMGIEALGRTQTWTRE